jgi:CDP-4-dehydro-6-deoxyglucose reductase
MSHYIPLSRVTRLIGISRHSLQEMIRTGLLNTFDGMVELHEVLRAFPDMKWEDDAEFLRISEIKEKAFGKRVFERALPDKEVLAARLFELGNEYAATRALLMHYSQVLSWLDEKIDEIEEEQSEETRHALHTLRAFIVRHLAEVPPDAERATALIAQERMIRIMSAHVTIRPSGHEFFVEGNETILEAALRAGLSLNYGCSNGNCGECRARLVSGDLRKVRPHDYMLTPAERDQGMFLMCASAAVTDLVIEASIAGVPDIPEQHLSAKIKSLEVFNPKVAALHLLLPRSQRLRFLAGQSVRLSAHGTAGQYAIASCPCEERHIEVQIARHAEDSFSELAFAGLRAQDSVDLQGPYGAFVLDDASPRPIIFLAFGTGFARIKSLIQHAMSVDMAEKLQFHWVADDTGHYQSNVCRAWSDAIDNFTYVLHNQNDDVRFVVAKIVSGYPDLHRFDVYASGTEEQMQVTKSVFLKNGLPEQQWRAA